MEEDIRLLEEINPGILYFAKDKDYEKYSQAIQNLLKRYKELQEENKNIEYVEKNYVHKDEIRKFIQENIFNVSYNEQDIYLQGKRDENDRILDKLEGLLEGTKDENISDRPTEI